MFKKWLSTTGKLGSEAFQRFPVSITLAAILAILLVFYAGADYSSDWREVLPRIIMAAGLALPLSITLHERTRQVTAPIWQKTALWSAAGLLIMVFITQTPAIDFDSMTQLHGFRWLLYFAAANLSISLSFYEKSRESVHFWALNMETLFRFVTGVLFTGALTIGLNLALAACDFLFDLNIRGERYVQVFFINHAFVMTVFILAGFPDKNKHPRLAKSMPPALTLFNLYVLIPLSIVYLAILTAYSAQIIMMMSLPKGIVGIMIIYYAFVGFTAFLFAFPLLHDADKKIARIFLSAFIFTLPLVFILFWIAIGIRIMEYGFTMERVLVFWLGIWLSVMVGWALFTRMQHLPVIPVTLFFMLIFAATGPSSIKNLPETSQISQIERLTASLDGLTLPEKLKYVNNLDSTSVSRVASSIEYLSQTHGATSLQPLLNQPVEELLSSFSASDTTFRSTNTWQLSSKMLDHFGLKEYKFAHANWRYWSAETETHLLRNVSGYTVFTPVEIYPPQIKSADNDSLNTEPIPFQILNNSDLEIQFDYTRNAIVFDVKQTGTTHVMPLEFEKWHEIWDHSTSDAYYTKKISPDEGKVLLTNDTFKAALHIRSIRVLRDTETKSTVEFLQGYLFLDI